MAEKIFVLCVAAVGCCFGAVKLWMGYWEDRRRLAARYRATETADVAALRQALSILDMASTALIREELDRGGYSYGNPEWSKVYHATKAIQSQLNDVTSLAMGDKLK